MFCCCNLDKLNHKNWTIVHKKILLTAMLSMHSAGVMLYVSHYSLQPLLHKPGTLAETELWLRPQKRGQDGLKQRWRWIKAGRGLATQGPTAMMTEDTCPVRRYIWMRAESNTRPSCWWVFLLWTAGGQNPQETDGRRQKVYNCRENNVNLFWVQFWCKSFSQRR